MTTQVLTAAKVWSGGIDLSSDLNAVALEGGVEPVEATTFGVGTKIYQPGLKTVKASYAGLLDLGPTLSEEYLASLKRVEDAPFSVAPTAGVEGDPAYTFRAMMTQFDKGGQVGQLLKLTGAAEASTGPLVRGSILINASKSAGGNGTAFQLGAVASGQSIYAALHLLALGGVGTLTVKVQSAAAVGFGTPNDRLSFAGLSGVTGYDWQQATPGVLTDTWWRVTWTLTATSALFAVIFGIQ